MNLYKKMGWLLLASCLFVAVGTSSFAHAAGQTFYVATNGSDANAGTSAAPFATFSKALTVAGAGDEVIAKNGVYTERLNISVGGTANSPLIVRSENAGQAVLDGQNQRDKLINVAGSGVKVAGFEVKNSNGYGVDLGGNDITVENLTVHEIFDHGIYTDGQRSTIRNNTVYRTNLENQPRSASSGWGSAIKVRVGGDNSLIENNTVYQNYGEGIAVTRGLGSIIRGNTTYDNFSVNIYVDNSKDVLVEKNHSYCTANSGFEKLDGTRPVGIATGEEYYDGWGAQLARITITNNIVANCSRGVIVYDADVSGGGLATALIAHNTFWGSLNTAISTPAKDTKTGNVVIANNVVHQPDGKGAYIDDRTGIEMKNNFWVGSPPADWANASGTGDKSGDVKLASSPNALNPASFKLAADSPAINAGAQVSGVTTDFENSSRDSQPDMGAFEYGGQVIPSPTPSPTPSPSPSPSPSVSPSPSPSVTPSPSPEVCDGADINLDGIVDIRDYTLLASNFLQDTPSTPRADINGDGRVDIIDYSILAQHFFESC